MPVLPRSIQRLIDFAISELNPRKILLFGSRARGSHRLLSDFDLAFVCDDDCSYGQWARFSTEVEERPLTLLPVDLVNYAQTSEQFRSRIDAEGVVIYERT